MDDQNVLTWNFANWLTISLMVLILYAVIGFGAKLAQARKAR